MSKFLFLFCFQGKDNHAEAVHVVLLLFHLPEDFQEPSRAGVSCKRSAPFWRQVAEIRNNDLQDLSRSAGRSTPFNPRPHPIRSSSRR
jgi:hypothetical protein